MHGAGHFQDDYEFFLDFLQKRVYNSLYLKNRRRDYYGEQD
jgi:hypothetical protein